VLVVEHSSRLCIEYCRPCHANRVCKLVAYTTSCAMLFQCKGNCLLVAADGVKAQNTRVLMYCMSATSKWVQPVGRWLPCRPVILAACLMVLPGVAKSRLC
jgi:hypothetical protein